MGVLPAQLGAVVIFQAGFPQVLFSVCTNWKEDNNRRKGCEQAEMGRGTRVCVYPFVEMGNPEANRLSRPWVQVIESEC